MPQGAAPSRYMKQPSCAVSVRVLLPDATMLVVVLAAVVGTAVYRAPQFGPHIRQSIQVHVSPAQAAQRLYMHTHTHTHRFIINFPPSRNFDHLTPKQWVTKAGARRVRHSQRSKCTLPIHHTSHACSQEPSRLGPRFAQPPQQEGRD